MIDINVSLDLMEFVETQILPRYANFDQAHRLTTSTMSSNSRWLWPGKSVPTSTWLMSRRLTTTWDWRDRELYTT